MLIGKNKLKMCKKALVLFFAFLFSIESFGAVISDNDGSAFITKAEFEVLKNGFNEQIEQYNRSIDNKIDGAIASYLSGIKLSTEPEDLYEKVTSATGGDLRFVKEVKDTSDTLSAEINIACINRYYVKTNVSPDLDYESWRTTQGSGDTRQFSHMLVRVIPNAENYYGGHSAYNFDECYDRSGPWAGYDSTVAKTDAGISWKYFNYNHSTGGGVVGDTDFSRNDWQRGFYSFGSSIYTDETYNPLVKLKNNNLQNIESSGDGKLYTFQLVNGKRVIDEYASSYWPILRGTATWHSYADYWAKSLAAFRQWHEHDNGMSLGVVQTADTGRISGWGSLSWGTSVTDEAESNGYWGTITYALCKNTDGIDYSVIQWGKGTDVDVYACSTNEPVVIANSYTTFTFNNSNYKHNYYDYNDLTKKEQTNSLPSNVLRYYKPSITPMSYKLNTFTNSYLSAIAGETVYLGGGMPIIKTTDDEQRIKIKFNVHSSAGTTSPVKVLISDKQFKNGAFDTGATHFYDNNCIPQTDYEVTIDVEKNNQVIWMNLYDTSADDSVVVNINDFNIELK